MIEKESNRRISLQAFSALIAWIAGGLCVMSAEAAVPTGLSPRLVVTIQVDQLRTDILTAYRPYYGTAGWERLLSGTFFPAVRFDFWPLNAAAAAATVQSGAYPRINGVVSASVFDRKTRIYRSIFEDNRFMGNYGTGRYSPLALQVETIGDALKEQTSGKAIVYSFAPDPETALAAAGQWGDGAFWIDERSAAWATTTYYKNTLPWMIDRRNRSTESIERRLSSLRWIPVSSKASALFGSFSLRPGASPLLLRQSAPANEEITSMALAFLEHGGYRETAVPSLLSLTYYAGPYPEAATGQMKAIEADIYLRLDAQLARLLEALDKIVGRDKYVVMLVGTGYFEALQSDFSANAGSLKVFSPERCKALLNMYLMALHGQAEWVTDYREEQLFLNRTLIEEKKMDLGVLQQESADFLADMAGIYAAVPASRLDDMRLQQEVAELANGSNRQYRGDILLSLLPGWRKEADVRHSSNTCKTMKARALTPLILYGGGFDKQAVSSERPSVRAIAPLLAYVLRIRPPTAAQELPPATVLQRIISAGRTD